MMEDFLRMFVESIIAIPLEGWKRYYFTWIVVICSSKNIPVLWTGDFSITQPFLETLFSYGMLGTILIYYYNENMNRF